MVPLGVVAAAVLFFWMDPGHISKRLATIANIPYKPEVTLAERMFVSQDSMHIFADYPWLGTGLGSFEVIYPRYQSFATDLMWDHAHNDYAEVLAETGIVGAALILVALGLFFRLAFRDLRQRLQHEVGWIHLGATLGCCGLLVHSFGDFNFHIPANAAWFAVCAAIASQSKAVARTTDILSS
jgi:O-antigen ligase